MGDPWNLVIPGILHKVQPVRPPLVVLHGALGSATQLAPVAAELAPLGEVHRVELPGHGDTALGTVPFTIDGFAVALRAALLQRGIERPVVFGYSMGGYIALALESSWPGTIAGLVTLGTKYRWTADSAAAEADKLDPDAIRAASPRFAEALADRHRIAGGWEGVAHRTAGLMRALGRGEALTIERLRAIRCPVHCAVGERDAMVSVEETRDLADAVRGNTWVLAGVQHPIERLPAGTVLSLMRSALGLE